MITKSKYLQMLGLYTLVIRHAAIVDEGVEALVELLSGSERARDLVSDLIWGYRDPNLAITLKGVLNALNLEVEDG